MNEGLTVEATIQDVEHDVASGWYKIVTDQGDYSTKIRENAEDALRLRNQRALINYTERVVTKPAADGSGMRTYRNRYFSRASAAPNGGAPAGSGFTTTGGQQTALDPAEGFTPPSGERSKTNREDAWRMAMTSGSERAVQTLPMLAKEQQSFESQKAIALAWAKWIFFTPVPIEVAGTAVMPHTLPTIQPEVETQLAALAGAGAGGYEEAPPHGDDDIPF